MSLLHELKRRNVFKVGVAYVVVAWLVLQVVDILLPMLNLPDWVGRFVMLLIAVGFPFALIMAWAVEVTPKGVQLDIRKGRAGSDSSIFSRALGVVAAATITVGFSYLLFERLDPHDPSTEATVSSAALQEPFQPGTTDIAEISDQQRIIAVLPFDDMSPGGGQTWLADGLAEDLLDLLSRIDGLRVIARTSSFALRGQDISIVGDRLGAGSAVEGSVRMSGEKLRVTAQLIRVADRTHVWSNSYDRSVDDVFEIQREIAAAVANAIGEQLGLNDHALSITSQPEHSADFRAWRLVKLANQRGAELTEDSLRSQIDLCSRALEIDPGYASAHSCIGSRSQELWKYGIDMSTERVLTATNSAQRVLELDSGDEYAQARLQLLELGSREGSTDPVSVEAGFELMDIAALSYVFAQSGDVDRAARVWIDASPSSEEAVARQEAFEENGYPALIDAVISDHVSRSGSSCMEDPAAAAFLFAVRNQEEDMFACMSVAVSRQGSREFFKLHPVFEPYRASERFRQIIAGG